MGERDPSTGASIVQRVQRIGATIAATNASDVDVRSRFPREAFDAFRAEGVLSAGIPTEYGGSGCSLSDLAAMCQSVGRYCSASGMSLAMHFIQVEVLVDAAERSDPIAGYLREVARDQRLIGSATSEIGARGMRESCCHVERASGAILVTKRCATVSYGEEADDILFQARVGADAAPSNQCMVLAVRDSFTFRAEGTWDMLGMRGTCSAGGTLEVTGAAWQVLDAPFAQIMNRVMVPVSHLLWASVWSGIAQSAEAKANAALRAAARARPGMVPPAASTMAQLARDVQVLRATITDLLVRFEGLQDRSSLEGVALMLDFNNLKVFASEMVVSIVERALRVCGISAYRNDSPQSLSRELRDAHSAALMVNNHSIQASSEALHLVHKPDDREH